MVLSRILALAAVAALAPRGTAQLPDLEAVLTADNAYAVGLGSRSQLRVLQPAVSNCLFASQIFSCFEGPEVWTFSGVQPDDYLYVVAWSDTTGTQGLLGQARMGPLPVVTTGDPRWEVYATGQDYPCNSPGPGIEGVNARIQEANLALGAPGATSIGWVDRTARPAREGTLVVGESNADPAGTFPLVCQPSSGLANGILARARWIWYRRDDVTNPFSALFGGDQREYLIFRLPVKAFLAPYVPLGKSGEAGAPQPSAGSAG